MTLITQIICDSPDFWQTYLQDPASISMEGILIFNKHLLFLSKKLKYKRKITAGSNPVRLK